MKKLLLAWFLFVPYLAISQNKTQLLLKLTGKVIDAETQKPLVGASVTFDLGKKGVLTDTAGVFRVQLPRGEITMHVVYVGYKPFRLKVGMTQNKEILVELENNASQLDEVVVSSTATKGTQNLSIGLNTLSIKGVKKLPAVMGEVDILRSLQTLPGITSVGEGSNGVNVRGGNVDQNLIYVDDAPIFNPSHLFGIFSVFPADAIRGIELYKGGIPARYGGRTSSVMDIKMLEPTTEKFRMNGGIGPVSNRIMLEIPIIKDKLSILSAARVSYNDFWLKMFGKPSIAGTKANFFDVANRIFFRPSSKSTLSLSNYLNNDYYGIDSLFSIKDIITKKTQFQYGHRNYSLRFNYFFSTKFNFNLVGVLANYDTKTFSNDEVTKFDLLTKIQYKNIKANFEYTPSEKHKINYGISGIKYDISPGKFTSAFQTSTTLPNEQSYELGIYASDEIQLNEKWSAELGLRYVQFLNIGPYSVNKYSENEPKSNDSVIGIDEIGQNKSESSFGGIEPRLAIKYSLGKEDAIKFGFNRMNQFVQLISNNTTPLPTARWKTSDRFIRPQQSDFLSLGYFKSTPNDMYEYSAEAYYKQTNHVIDFTNGADLQLNPNLETQLLDGNGKAYGLEMMLTKKKGETTGWISYTYARALQQILGDFPELQQLNEGNWFPTNYDKPHTVNLMMNSQIGKHHSFSFTFAYSTGRPYTAPVGIFQQGILKYPIYTERNNGRISDYHRLDFSWTIANPAMKEKRWEGSWVFTVFNIYGRNNAYSYFFKPAPYGLIPYKLSVFSSPFLSLNYNFKFR